MRAGEAVEQVGHREEGAALGREGVEHLRHIAAAFVAGRAARPDDRQVFVERHGKVDHLTPLRTGDQRGRDRRIGDGDAAALATRSARMLRGEDREERAGGRQAAEVRAALDPDHAAAAARLMRGRREIGQRTHARAVEAERHHAAAGQIDHRLWRGGGPARRLLLQRRGDEAVAGGKRFVIRVGVVAAEEHHIAGGQRPVLEFPLADDLGPDQAARARLRLVAARCDVDHAGLAAELPGGHLVAGDQAHRAGPWQPRVGRRHEVCGGIPLRARVLVDDEHVAMPAGAAKRRGGHDGERRHAHWPDAGMLW